MDQSEIERKWEQFADVPVDEDGNIETQLERTPTALPTLEINKELASIDIEEVRKWAYLDFSLSGYNPQPSIKAELSTGLVK